MTRKLFQLRLGILDIVFNFFMDVLCIIKLREVKNLMNIPLFVETYMSTYIGLNFSSFAKVFIY